jgi:uncharacterized protein
MRVDVKPISRNIGASIDISVTCSPEEIDLSFNGFEFNRPIELQGLVTSVSQGVMTLTGKFKTGVKSNCDRCLDDVNLDIEDEFAVLFRSVYDRDENLHDADDDEEESYSYDGYSIVLDKALRDSIILALPLKVLCSEECKGICEWCKKNLNEEECHCKSEMQVKTNIFDELKNLL